MKKLAAGGIKDQKSDRMGTHRVRQDRDIRGLDPRSRARNNVGEVIASECHSINRMIVLAANNVVDAEHRSTPCSSGKHMGTKRPAHTISLAEARRKGPGAAQAQARRARSA